MSDLAPLVHTLRVQVDAATVAVDTQSVIGEAPFAGTVTRAGYIAAAAVTGANTNSRTLTVTNRGAAGSSTTVVASYALTAGNNLVADDEKDLTLSGTPANLVVAAGDVISFESVHVGTGIADPGGAAFVEITRS